MTLALIVYLIGILPVIKGALFISGFSSLIIMGFLALNAGIDRDVWGLDSEKGRRGGVMLSKLFKKLWIPCVLLVLYCFIPGKTTMYTMVAAYAGQTIAETPEAQQIGNEAVDVVKELLAKAKRELQEESKQ
jgi:hypothetical protein